MEICEAKPECTAIVDYGFGPAIRELNATLLKNLADQKRKRQAGTTTTPEAVIQAPKVAERVWTVGDSCLTRWEMDGIWYPGTVVEISKETGSCVVEFQGTKQRAGAVLSQLQIAAGE